MYKLDKLIEESKKDIMNIVGGDSIVDYYNYGNYIQDSFSSIADNYVDIYTCDLLDWLKNNYDEFENYMNEFEPDRNGKFDLISYIRGAQFITYECELNQNKDNILLYLSYYVIKKELGFNEITEEQKNNIDTINFDYIDTFEELANNIKETLGIDEGEKMYINLKDIDTNYILNKCEYAKKTYTKDIIIKAIEKLKKDNLKVDTSNMHVYRNNQLVERFSLLSDELEDVKNFKDSENKTDWMIKWYFSGYVNNETHKFIYN